MKITIEIPFDLAIKLKNSGLDPLEILENKLLGYDPAEKVAPDKAVKFLTELLSGGSVTSTVVLERARRAGISRRALDSAKNSLGVLVEKKGFRGHWSWSMPNSGARAGSNSKKRAASIMLDLYGGIESVDLNGVYRTLAKSGIAADVVDAAIEFLNWSTRDEGGTIYLQTHNLC